MIVSKLKNILSLSFVFLLLSGSVAYAQSAIAVSASDEDEALIAFDKDVIDYGVIEQNSNGVRIFKFKNNGSVPLIIKNAQGSCGCTVPSYPKEPIMPGKSSEIKVSYDTRRVGKFKKTVTIYSNASNEARKVLRIQGEVKEKMKTKS